MIFGRVTNRSTNPTDFHFAECSAAVSRVNFAADDKGRLVTRSEHGERARRKEENPGERGFRERRSIRPLFGEDAIKRDEQA